MYYLIAFLKQLNWVDLFVVVVLFRVLLIGLKTGIGSEIFKLFGTLTAVYLSLHYYVSVAGYTATRFGLQPAFVECFFFLVFACLGYALFLLIRLLLKRFVNMEVVPTISRLAGLVVGVMRAFLLVSLMLYFLLITGNPYLRKSIKTSFSGMGLVYLGPTTYSFFWETIVSKLSPKEKFNNAVFEIERDNYKKKK